MKMFIRLRTFAATIGIMAIYHIVDAFMFWKHREEWTMEKTIGRWVIRIVVIAGGILCFALIKH